MNTSVLQSNRNPLLKFASLFELSRKFLTIKIESNFQCVKKHRTVNKSYLRWSLQEQYVPQIIQAREKHWLSRHLQMFLNQLSAHCIMYRTVTVTVKTDFGNREHSEYLSVRLTQKEKHQQFNKRCAS